MITLPGVAVYIIRFLARRVSLGNHSFFKGAMWKEQRLVKQNRFATF